MAIPDRWHSRFERAAFGGEQQPGRSRHPGNVGTGVDPVTISDQVDELARRIAAHGLDDRRRDREPGHDARRAGAERGDAALVGRDRRRRRDVDPTHQVLGHGHAGDRGHGIGIETGRHQPMPRRIRQRVELEHPGRQYRYTVCTVTVTPREFHIAQLNIATLQAPVDDPATADFTDNLERINALGEGSPGFVWRLQTDDGDATALRPYPDPMIIVNMTVWTSVAALKEYAYRTEHAEFVARRREWFVPGSTGLVLWWIRAGDLPTVDDAKRRLEFLRRHGPSPYAFRFARPPAPFVVEQTSLEDPATLDLITALNTELTGRYDHPSDNHFRLEPDEVSPGMGAVVVGRLEERAVACGAIRRIDWDVDGDIDGAGGRTAEIKRMYVAPAARGNKLGAAILDRLELEATELGIDRLVLETGSRQPEAIQLYERAGFTPRDRWGEYADAPHSRCYEKRLEVPAITTQMLRDVGDG